MQSAWNGPSEGRGTVPIPEVAFATVVPLISVGLTKSESPDSSCGSEFASYVLRTIQEAWPETLDLS